MTQQILIQLSEWLLFFVAGISFIVISLASMYDFRTIARRRYEKTHMARLQTFRQPHITILVYAKNNETTIEACLASIGLSHYQNYDIVVIDNVSTDTTKQTTRAYKRKNLNLPLYFYGKRESSDRLLALRQGYRVSQRGDIVLVLDGTATIKQTFLAECSVRFMADPSLRALRLNEQSHDIYSLNLLAWRLVRLSWAVCLKAGLLFRVGRLDIGQANAVYAGSLFTPNHKIKRVPYRYDGQLVVLTEPDRGARGILLWPLGCALLFVTYFMYLAASLQSAIPLALSWLILVIWLLAAVWSDEISKLREKIVLAFCLPAVYFLLYFQSIVYLSARITKAVVPGLSFRILFGRKLA